VLNFGFYLKPQAFKPLLLAISDGIGKSLMFIAKNFFPMLSDLKLRAFIRQANLISTRFRKTLMGISVKIPGVLGRGSCIALLGTLAQCNLRSE